MSLPAAAKRLLQRGWVQMPLAALVALWLWLIHRSGRWRIEGEAQLATLGGRPFIACFWHGRILMMAFLRPPGLKIDILISRHRDGRLIARVMNWLGAGVIDGSTRRGGAAALRQIQRGLAAGRSVGITPDGPRGPRMRAQIGAAAAARLTGTPLLPVAYSARPARLARSWDRLLLPRWFARGVYVIGAPLDPAGYPDNESLRLALEAALNAATAEADRLAGRPPVEPAPEADPARA